MKYIADFFVGFKRNLRGQPKTSSGRNLCMHKTKKQTNNRDLSIMKQKKSTKKFLKGAAKSAVKAKHEGKPTGKKFGKPGAGKPVGKNAVGDLGEAHREDQIIKLKNPKSKKGGGDLVKG